MSIHDGILRSSNGISISNIKPQGNVMNFKCPKYLLDTNILKRRKLNIESKDMVPCETKF